MINDIFVIIQSLDRDPSNPIPLYEISKHLSKKGLDVTTETLTAYLLN